jgi:PAS domain S-box-containing protein
MSARRKRQNRIKRGNARSLALLLVFMIVGLASVSVLAVVLGWSGTQGLIITGAVAGVVVLVTSLLIVKIYGMVGEPVEKKAEVKVEKVTEAVDGKFKALIQHSLDFILIIDRRGTVLYASPSCDRLLGYRVEEMELQPIFEFLHSEDHSLLQNALDQDAQNFFFQFRVQHRDGAWYYFEAVGTNLQDNPHINGIVLNARDITDRKREEENRKQKEMAALRFNIEREKAEREKQIIEESKKQLEEAYHIIEHKNSEITDSITYAFRIQTAIVPSVDLIKEHLPNSFVLWKPKDIVSGDFYWFANVGSRSLISAADCTGHGVPGAFMTMIGNTLLNQIVLQEGELMPDKILNYLHVGVRKALKQDQEGSKSRDGMDISFMVVDHAEKKVYWAGANNPLIYIKGGEMTELKPDKKSIGGLQTEDERIFTLHEIPYNSGDVFYIYSDGYQDQFGGPKGRKFMTKRLKEMLHELSSQEPDVQYQKLDTAIIDWMGDNYEQVDDILIVGMRM